MCNEQNFALEDGVPELLSKNELADTGQSDQRGKSTPKIELLKAYDYDQINVSLKRLTGPPRISSEPHWVTTTPFVARRKGEEAKEFIWILCRKP